MRAHRCTYIFLRACTQRTHFTPSKVSTLHFFRPTVPRKSATKNMWPLICSYASEILLGSPPARDCAKVLWRHGGGWNKPGVLSLFRLYCMLSLGPVGIYARIASALPVFCAAWNGLATPTRCCCCCCGSSKFSILRGWGGGEHLAGDWKR